MAIVYPNDRAKEFGKLRDVKPAEKVQSTGYRGLDPFLQLAKKYLMIVTGYPGSGKSEFIDAILINTAILHNWKTCFFSPENNPTEEHMAKLAEKYIGMGINGFKPKDLENSLAWVQQYFSWAYFEDSEPTLDEIIKDINLRISDGEIDVLVIDPWNAMTHDNGNYRTDIYLGMELSKLIRFARKQGILVIVIAHPKTPQKDKNGLYPDADMYSVTDGVMWRNKGDYGIVVKRPDMEINSIIIEIQKIKFKWMGRVGFHELHYDRSSGRFKEIEDEEYQLPLAPGAVEPPF